MPRATVSDEPRAHLLCGDDRATCCSRHGSPTLWACATPSLHVAEPSTSSDRVETGAAAVTPCGDLRSHSPRGAPALGPAPSYMSSRRLHSSLLLVLWKTHCAMSWRSG